jgi:pilus assembly protein CpaE
MSQPIRTVVALGANAEREAAAAWLAAEPAVQIVGFVDQEQDHDTAVETPSDLLVLVSAGYSQRSLSLIENAVLRRPDRPVVVLCSGSPNGYVRQVFQAGADDIVMLPDPDSDAAQGATAEQIRFALQKALARRRGLSSSGRGPSGELVCVLGPKGGAGKTLTSTNLAVGLAKEGHAVVLVDLDLQFGDVGLALGLDPERTIYDLATSSGSLDEEKLDAYLARHESGVHALLAPVRPDQAAAIKVDYLRELFTMLRATHDYVVVDTPPGFTADVIAAIDASSHLLMVCTLDSLSLKNTRLGLETLQLMGYDEARIRLVLNRADSRIGISAEDVTTILGRDPDVLVPSQREIAMSLSNGTPIAAAGHPAAAARAFGALAGLIAGQQDGSAASAAAEPRRRLLRRRG